MKFIRLEILNLASLDRKEGEVIDFESGVLKNCTIFSIVGPMGSGKSTLLDAICLALYNRAPRYPRKKFDRTGSIEIFGEPDEGEKNRLAPTDCRNILTQGKKRGYSKLTFLTNNGDLYRAEWHVEFKVKNYADPVTLLYKITVENGEPKEVPAVWEDLPKIIGLEYEQFLRTVLIAQGSFANFLTAKEEERYALLEKLIGCEELYDTISKQIKEKKEAAVKEFNTIDTSYSTYQKDILPEELLEQLREKIVVLEEAEKQSKAELVKINDALRWFAEETTMQQNLQKFTDEMNKAEKALEAAKPDFDRLSLHDATLQATAYYKEIKDATKNVEHQRKTLDSIDADSVTLGGRIQKGEAFLKEQQEAEAKAVKALEEQKPHINRARTIKGELEAARKTVAEKQTAYNECKKAFKPYENTLNPETVTEEILNAEIAKTDGVDAAKLQDAKSAAVQKQHDLQDAIRIREGIQTKQETQKKQASQREQLAKQHQSLSNELQQLNTGIPALTQELETLRKSFTLMTSEKWEQHRQHLVDGQPCPLCGATEHPYHSAEALAPVVDELQQLIETKEATLKDQRKRQTDLSKETGELKGKIQGIDDNQKTLAEEISKLQVEWEKVRGKYPEWSEEVAQLEQLRPAVDQELKDASEALASYNTVVANIEKYRKCLALNKANSALKEAEALVKQATDSLQAEVGDKDPDRLEQELTDVLNKVRSQLQAANDKLATLRLNLEGLKGRREETQKNLDTEKAKLDKSNESLRLWLDDYNAKHPSKLTVEDIDVIFASADNWEAIRKSQTQLADALTTAKTTLANEQKRHEEHQESKPAETQEALLERKTQLENQSNNELVDAKTRVKRHDDALQQMGTLYSQRQAAETTKNEWENISKAIGSDGKTLRKIAQCYTLRFLIAHANVEIRKFNNRYELQQVKNSLGIRVVDHDRADLVRDTTSLSGGETFIVSLGLALGLSALSSKNISFENLFIDEGFGTLDPTALATVLDALAMLQSSQGKKVGVISHTNTMSEKITTQIRVVKIGETGSSYIDIYPKV